MRTRLPGTAAALIAAVLAFSAPAAQAAQSAKPPPSPSATTTTAKDCVSKGGTVEYDSDKGQWTCFGGDLDELPIK
ncbi:hypothetical protein LG634_22975 [Streptomyces bambusae]|uniref:hypothetical protein n=1 Tax=Streptomyces bambusae TaxID=1550616 RepID=UPI001CFD4704|nr:hypothetical protein [Streptomyces bambusae]MCB5167681.1 hypothetical protein [Streptomyces bambusae]